MPGYPSYPYPDDDIQKLNLLFIYLFENKSSYEFIPRLAEYLDWELDEFQELHIKHLLIECGHTNYKRFSSSNNYVFKITDEAILGIHKYGSYKQWIENQFPEVE